MVSKVISLDIIKYLTGIKGYSVKEIARATNSSTIHIDNIINKKEQFTGDDIKSYLKFADISFWQFTYEAIPLGHIPEKTRNRVKICKEIHDHIEKKSKK
ncbi:MAG: hypothetical protein KR126chlam6_01509 [Candidatus Anoxychlamydiales bacterium]|nr:hypothetical protein [Candidatus Anoxychlamydiales bacterium]